MMKSLQINLPELDELDLMLIRELEKDPRASYVILASKLSTSPSTVSRRLNRLIEQGIISIAVKPYYAALGYETSLLLAINTFPWAVHPLAKQLASVNSIKFVWVTAGRYDILAIAMYRNLEEYLSAFPEEFGNLPANVKIETMLSAKIIKSSLDQRPYGGAAVTSRSRIKLSELDLSVIRELGKSPRVPVKELAREIGVSLPPVRSSLRKLTSQGIIRVVATRDPAAFGYNVNGTVLIQVHPSGLKTLTDKLKLYPCVSGMTLTIGAFNCVI